MQSLNVAKQLHAALFGPSTAVRTIDLGSGHYILHSQLFPSLLPNEVERQELWASQPIHREYFHMYGRLVAVPRRVRLYSLRPLTVRVSGGDFEATLVGYGSQSEPSYLARVLSSMPASCDYNAVVANWYPSGADYIGWHGDKEQQIDSDSAPIVSVSLGASRRFQVRNEATLRCVFDEILNDGDCVVMGGPGFQHKYKHRVPKMTAQRDGQVGPRINLTVRKYHNAVRNEEGVQVRRQTNKRGMDRSPGIQQGTRKAAKPS